MSDNAVKITALPAVSSLQSTDLIPVVDASGTQTVKADLQKVMDLGPGAGTVTESTLAPGAVTAGKTGFSTTKKIAYASSTASTNSSGRFVGTEASISDYTAQTLLQLESAAEWFAAMGVSPNFTGPVTVPFGGIQAVTVIDNTNPASPVETTDYQIRPTYTFGMYANVNGVSTFAGDLTTGMFGGDADSGEINFSSLDQRIMSLNKDRVIRVLQQTTVDANGTPVDDSATTLTTEDGQTVANRVTQNARMLQFIGANAYACFTPEQTSATAFDSGSSGTRVGSFLGLPASRRASTLVGTIHHGPNIRYEGGFGTWNGGGSNYPANGTGASHDGNGSGNILMMQKRLEQMGYDPNSLAIHQTHAYVSWWDNALINLGANFHTNPADFTSQRASSGNRTMIKRITASPIIRTKQTSIEKMRGFTSIEQSGTGVGAEFTCRFERPYPDVNYCVFIDGSGGTANVLGYSVTKYTDRITFKVCNNNGAIIGNSGAQQIHVATMR